MLLQFYHKEIATMIFRKYYSNNKTGKLLQKGDWIKFPELAKTYRKLADDGGETFYNVTEGSLGYDILQDLKEKSESLAHLSQICHYMSNLAK